MTEHTTIKNFQSFKKVFKEKMENKKGIMFFDMDQTIYTFLRYEDFKNSDITWCNDRYDQPFQMDDINKNFTQAINKETIDYIKSIKNDYMIVSNTSWSAKQIREIPSMEDFFDFYGSRAGMMIEWIDEQEKVQHIDIYNGCDTFWKRWGVTYPNKANINTFYYNVFDYFANPNGNINTKEKYKFIQFEDEMTGAEDITHFVHIASSPNGPSKKARYYGFETINKIRNDHNEDPQKRDEITINAIQQNTLHYDEKGIHYEVVHINDRCTGAIEWIKKNIY